MSKLIQIARYFDSVEAHIARGLLENNDIPCFLFDEHHNATAWHQSISIGGIRLMIHEDDLELARDILKKNQIYHKENIDKKAPLIRKPYLKTLLGTVVGFFVGAPTIKADRNNNE